MSIYIDKQGQGEPVVLLHGGGCTHRHMQPIVGLLKNDYQVLNVDIPGHGRSGWNDDINNIYDIADELMAVLPEEAIYIGWSYGGLLSLSIAARYPQRVKRLIGISTTPKFIESDDWPGFPKPGFKVIIDEMKIQGHKNFFKSMLANEFADYDPKPAAFFEMLEHYEESEEADLGAFSVSINICDDTDLREEFSQIRCPIDLILSDNDECVPVRQHALLSKLNDSVAIHLIPDSRHAVFQTNRAEFERVLTGLLK